MIQHSTIEANGARFHVAETGKGRPLLLLHGWPEFWFTWEPVMTRLADRFRLIAPDLRGFGDSDKPTGPFGPHDHASDLLELVNQLGIEKHQHAESLGIAEADAAVYFLALIFRALQKRPVTGVIVVLVEKFQPVVEVLARRPIECDFRQILVDALQIEAPLKLVKGTGINEIGAPREVLVLGSRIELVE